MREDEDNGAVLIVIVLAILALIAICTIVEFNNG